MSFSISYSIHTVICVFKRENMLSVINNIITTDNMTEQCKRRKIECSICCENVWQDTENKKNHWKCSKCEFSCCQDCARRYLLDSLSEPQCMSCNARISRHDLMNTFPKSWVTSTYKVHRENVLLDREKSLIPTSVEAVEREKTVREARSLLKELEKERLNIMNSLNANTDSINATKAIIRNGGFEVEASDARNKASVIQVVKCQKEGCHAFARKGTACSACETLTCYECMEIIQEGAEHTCVEEKKQTVAAARKQCKPCPGCGEFISKVEGCSQMWCINCHTTFDYRTGRKVSSAIHNPHYYEYMRKNPAARTRDPRDVQCGGVPEYRDIVEINRIFMRKYPDTADRWGVMDVFFNVHRILRHINHVEIPYYQGNAHDTTEALRVSFILNDFDEEEFKIKLQRHEKKQDHRREILEVFVMLQTAGTDILQRVVHGNYDTTSTTMKDKLLEHKEELVNLAKYANSLFRHIHQSFCMTERKLNTDWTRMS